MAKSTNYRGIHISVTYAMGDDYYEISQINKGKKWNEKTLFDTLKEAKMYIDEHYDELIKNESKKSARKSLMESTNIFDTLENAWDKSTMNNNVFEKTVLKLKTDSFKDPFDKYSTIYMFADGSSIDCDSLDPFDCEWCTYVSEDLSFVHEFKK